MAIEKACDAIGIPALKVITTMKRLCRPTVSLLSKTNMLHEYMRFNGDAMRCETPVPTVGTVVV